MHLMIMHYALVFGGAERTTANLLEHLDRNLITRLTLAAPTPLRDYLPDGWDRFVALDHIVPRGWFGSGRELLRDARAVAGLIERERPDAVLGMMHYSAALAAIGGRLARHRAQLLGSFRGPVFEHMKRYEQGRKRRLFLRLAVGVTARLADYIIVPSQGTADELHRHFLGPRRRTIVIPNGIDLAAAQTLAAQPVAELLPLPPANLPRPLICVAARLSGEKDLDLLLDAFARLHAARRDAGQDAGLLVIGDGPDKTRLEQQAKSRGLGEQVIFTGHRDNIYPLIRLADLYVHTCQFEGFGYSMLEAMACGTPVLATDCPYGPREVLGDNRFGRLVPPGDPAALADAMRRLLADPAQCAHFSERGLQRAHELSIRRMIDGHEAILQLNGTP